MGISKDVYHIWARPAPSVSRRESNKADSLIPSAFVGALLLFRYDSFYSVTLFCDFTTSSVIILFAICRKSVVKSVFPYKKTVVAQGVFSQEASLSGLVDRSRFRPDSGKKHTRI